MNILISINSKYIIPAKVMLKSLSKIHPEEKCIYLLYNDLSEKELHDFREFIKSKCNCVLHQIYVDSTQFSGMPLGHQFTVEIYFRLLADKLLPISVDKILWLDADIVIVNKIDSFYNQNLNGYAISVAPDTGSPEAVLYEIKEKLGISNNIPYYNSGVILFNLKYIRENSKKFDLFDALTKYSDRLQMPDQDILNLVYGEKILSAEEKFNYQIRYNDSINLADIEKNAAIIHYIGKVKPWNPRYVNDAKLLYWAHAKEVIGKSAFGLFLLKNYPVIFIERLYKIVRKKGGL